MGLNNSNGFEIVDKLIALSKNITRLYEQLMDAELYHGKDSKEYNTIVRNIDLSVEYESELKEIVYSSRELLLKYKDDIPYKDDVRACETLQNDPVAKIKLLEAMKNEEYEQLHDYGRVFCSKERYLKNACEPFLRKINISGALETLQQKTYVQVLDEEIKKTNDLDIKKALIREKNQTISKNPIIESWYFLFGNRQEAFIVDDDETVAKYLDMDVNLYKRIKSNYFTQVVDNIEDLVISNEDENSKEALNIYKMSLIGALINLDLYDVNERYKEFFQHVYDNNISPNSNNVEFVDKTYSEYPEYLKRIIKKR